MKKLNDYKRVLALDFEFTQNPGERPIPICGVVKELRSGRVERFWLAQPRQGLGIVQALVHPDHLLVTYFGAAEAMCLLALGISLPSWHADLHAEFRNHTCGLIKVTGHGLLDALKFFDLPAMSVGEKENMRALAMRGAPFSEEEKVALLDYCQADVEATARLAEVMLPEIVLPHALLRGSYVNVVGKMQHNGIPVDARMLQTIQENRAYLTLKLIEKVDADYGVYVGGHFNHVKFENWLKQEDLPWPRTALGKPKLDRDTFSELAKSYPQVEMLKLLRVTLSQFRTHSLPVGSDGRNRTLLSPFASKTGRNQPKTSEFIFGAAKWMRGCIRPAAGMALAYLDYEQQEFGAAAALSGDRQMQAAYNSGDPYLAFAKQAHAVPQTATKGSHPQEREQFKACALGVQYSMTIQGLAKSARLSADRAAQLYQLHRRTYPKYWNWSDAVLDAAIDHGKLAAVFGWQVLIDGKINPRFLRNFPLQANGAEMLRLACIFADQAGVSICAPVHDALLIEAHCEQIEDHVARCREAMLKASREVLGGFELRVEEEIIHYPNHFPLSGKSQQMWDTVMDLLTELPV
ncbi:MAG: DNA polymerase [Chthoniobacteraceae bacterium]